MRFAYASSGARRRVRGRSPNAGHHRRVLIGVKTLRFAPPPLRGADGLDADSALAAWAAMGDRPSTKKETRTMPIRTLTGVNDLPMLATVDETAALLRTTRKAIYSMIERGQLPGVTRIGRRVLISTPDLLDWLRQKSTPSLER